jgi:uncharacterized protein YrzB (UPF0473 family)
MEKETMVVIDEEGNEVLHEVVLTFNSKEFGKSYVIYKLPGDENEEVFASSYDETAQDGGDLKPIETDEEWDMVEEVLNAFLDEEDEE